MDGIETAIDLKKVKLDLYNQAIDNHFKDIPCNYDEFDDTAIMRFAPYQDGGEIVHFLDQFVSLIIRDSDYQVVGIMIENYNHGFRPEKSRKENCFTGTEMKNVKKTVKRELVLA